MHKPPPANVGAYIGIMSGTSLDGLDAVVASFKRDKVQIHAFASLPYPPEMAQGFAALFTSGKDEINRMQQLALSRTKLAAALVSRLKKLAPKIAIRAIGDHGQTVRHFPNGFKSNDNSKAIPAHTLQIQHGALLAELSGINTVVDFRSKDIVSGGQGAPFAPAFHQAFFTHPHKPRVIINIGGIANISLLAPFSTQEGNTQYIGFDTGPGNTLMDMWCMRHLSKSYDESGSWAKSGKMNAKLLKHLLDDPYFQLTAPKSTGREYFNLAWLDNKLVSGAFNKLAPQDVQASLAALTARSISNSILAAAPSEPLSNAAYVCGGGVKNRYLMQLLEQALGTKIQTTEALGVAPQQVEAAAFAWLARRAINQQATDLCNITGASKPNILGAIYPA